MLLEDLAALLLALGLAELLAAVALALVPRLAPVVGAGARIVALALVDAAATSPPW
ncbi:MAG: hypothetical protein P8R42_20830 [Candidatus Binatia bacterium]|nr:hypothetical protein [Candidatus Binatia bacterium]